jgi:hypothetical protein
MWLTIDKLHDHVKGKEMFVVQAFGIVLEGSSRIYTSDPYCTWLDADGNKPFPRWPHSFMPTHFCLLPEEKL